MPKRRLIEPRAHWCDNAMVNRVLKNRIPSSAVFHRLEESKKYVEQLRHLAPIFLFCGLKGFPVYFEFSFG